jgi:hypothetical protein
MDVEDKMTKTTVQSPAKDLTADQDSPQVSRRRFFKVLGGASGVALAAPMMSDEAQAGENKDEARKARYRESDHVKKYYSTNRY